VVAVSYLFQAMATRAGGEPIMPPD
jgi:hypothetical protein